MGTNGYFIGEVSRRAEVPTRTIRYYEGIGLLPEPERTASGYRHYPERTVEQLRFIKQAQALGFSLAEIKAIIQASDQSLDTCCDLVRQLLTKKIQRTETQMEDLRRMRRQLKQMLNQWVPSCEAEKQSYAVCPQIEQARPRKGGKRNGRKNR